MRVYTLLRVTSLEYSPSFPLLYIALLSFNTTTQYYNSTVQSTYGNNTTPPRSALKFAVSQYAPCHASSCHNKWATHNICTDLNTQPPPYIHIVILYVLMPPTFFFFLDSKIIATRASVVLKNYLNEKAEQLDTPANL